MKHAYDAQIRHLMEEEERPGWSTIDERARMNRCIVWVWEHEGGGVSANMLA